jgi:hypothetical protein
MHFVARLGLAALCAVLAFGAPCAQAAKGKPHRTILIGLDLSRSNPLVVDARYAQKVADRVGPMIKPLKIYDEVKIRTFGSYDARDQPLHIDQIVSARVLSDEVADVTSGVIAGVPTLIQRGTLKVQESTHILGFLDNMAQIVDCKKRDTVVVLASDGIEESENVKLTSEHGVLPKPQGQPFAGCTALQILGLGVGAKNPALTAHLREQWTAWAKAAGFERFEGLNDW